MYGVMLLLAIAACIWLTGTRWVRWGGDWDLIYRMSIWGVIVGIIGARVYHDITSWNQDSAIHAHWYGPFAVWSGGLGIWGAIPLGVLAGALVVRRSGNSVRLMMDAVAPGLLLAQGIGRWGNWWNQELYGKHTTLPWALEIHGKGERRTLPPDLPLRVSVGHLRRPRAALDRPPLQDPPARRSSRSTSRSTRRSACSRRRCGSTRRTTSSGQRINFWVALVCFVASVAFFIWWQFVRKPKADAPKRETRPMPKGPTMAVPRGRVR